MVRWIGVTTVRVNRGVDPDTGALVALGVGGLVFGLQADHCTVAQACGPFGEYAPADEFVPTPWPGEAPRDRVEPLPAGFGVQPASERVEARRKRALGLLRNRLHDSWYERVAIAQDAAHAVNLEYTRPPAPDFDEQAAELLEIGMIDAAHAAVMGRSA